VLSSTDLYPVVTVDPEWKLDSEAMGTKDKFWYQRPDDDSRWLFKFPRESTGEHWSEKIAAEVAALLNAPCGRVELAELGGVRGSVTEAFAGDREELRHGNELLEEAIPGYDPQKKRGQSQHTLGNIRRALDRAFDRSAEARSASRTAFSGYLVLDAVIGNTDRHHENWGILIERNGQNVLRRLAPSFDHASSLGRELSDDRRQRLLKEDRIGHYSERGRGGIFLSEADRRAPGPLGLVRQAVRDHPAPFAPALERAAQVSDKDLRRSIDRVPEHWMSPSARDFSLALMHYNLRELRKRVR